uniref:ARID domain-containing protein n=1 Tax=Theileria annulata TaxID=5874 RepID=A0A3B0MLD7_THEAN
MDEEEFYENLKNFHGPEKYFELTLTNPFPTKVDLFRFYQCIRRSGDSIESAITTRWHDICSEIGVTNPSDTVTPEEAHKASSYFCDLFLDFHYPNHSSTHVKEINEKNKPTTPSEYINKNSDSNDGIKYQKVDWTAEHSVNQYRGSKLIPTNTSNATNAANTIHNTIQNVFSDKNNSDEMSSVIDDDWKLPLYQNVPSAYKMRSKMDPTTKLLEESEYSESEEDEELLYDIIYEISKYIIGRIELEYSLKILLKTLIISNLPDIPNLISTLSLINYQYINQLTKSHQPQETRPTRRIVILVNNILILIVRNSFINYENSSAGDTLDSAIDDKLTLYDQATVALKSLQHSTIILFKLLSTGNNLGFNHVDSGLANDNFKLSDTLNNILLLIKYLIVISTSQWQFDLLHLFINQVLSSLISATNTKDPVDSEGANTRDNRDGIGATEDLVNECVLESLEVFFKGCNEMCKKLKSQFSFKTVLDLYTLAVRILKCEGVGNSLKREIFELLLTFHTYFHFSNRHMHDNMRFILKLFIHTLINSTHNTIPITKGSDTTVLNQLNTVNTNTLDNNAVDDNTVDEVNNNVENDVIDSSIYNKEEIDKFDPNFKRRKITSEVNHTNTTPTTKDTTNTSKHLINSVEMENHTNVNNATMSNEEVEDVDDDLDDEETLDTVYCNESVGKEEQLTLEDSISFLQFYYKTVFGIFANQSTTSTTQHTNNTKDIDLDGNNGSEMMNEIICKCIEKLLEYPFCAEILEKNYDKLLECAFKERSRSLWSLIHNLMSKCSHFKLNCSEANYYITHFKQIL